MIKSMTRDITGGSLVKLILGFFIPMLCGLLSQQLYNMADTTIVGKFLGVKALAAVGSTDSTNFMTIGSCLGACSGFVIPVAQEFGEKNMKTLWRFVASGDWLAAAFVVVITTTACLFCRNVLELTQTPEDIIGGAHSYIFVIFLGVPATYLYNLLSRTLRSLGDNITFLLFLVFSSMVNVALDLFIILVLDMGVAGAGWAIITAQAMSGLLCLFYMKKKHTILKMNEDEWKSDRHYMKILCNMGTPMGLQYSITAIGSVVLQIAVNFLGSTAVAAATVGSKINMFFCYPFDTLGSTMATYGGQSMGARKLNWIDQGLKAGPMIDCVYVVIASGVLLFLGDLIALMFVDPGEAEILRNTKRFLIANSVFYIPFLHVNMVRSMIQGLGFSRLVILAGVCEMVIRTFVGFCLVPVFGYMAVCIVSSVTWTAADPFLLPAYRYVTRNLKHLSYGNGESQI